MHCWATPFTTGRKDDNSKGNVTFIPKLSEPDRPMRTDSGSGNDCAVQCGIGSACRIPSNKTKGLSGRKQRSFFGGVGQTFSKSSIEWRNAPYFYFLS